jgi:hypothetical protein
LCCFGHAGSFDENIFMEKILLAIDSGNMNLNALDFTCYLARLTKSKVTGVFLDNSTYEEKPVMKQLYGMPYVETIIAADLPDYTEKSRRIQGNIQFFKQACGNRGVRWNIHRPKGVPEKELIKETRYADLLVVSAEISFEKKFEGTPTKFVRNILGNAECPVVISPDSFDALDEIVFAYDGNRASMIAIRQFTYLFPEYRNKKATVLEVSGSGSTKVEEKDKITEWLNAHYTNTEFVVLPGEARDEIFSYLLNKKDIFLVMGSYGRSMLSNMFKPSSAKLVMRALSLPVFVAHY